MKSKIQSVPFGTPYLAATLQPARLNRSDTHGPMQNSTTTRLTVVRFANLANPNRTRTEPKVQVQGSANGRTRTFSASVRARNCIFLHLFRLFYSGIAVE